MRKLQIDKQSDIDLAIQLGYIVEISEGGRVARKPSLVQRAKKWLLTPFLVIEVE